MWQSHYEFSGLAFLFVLQIAQGKLNGVNKADVGLKALHCIELSKHAMEIGHYYIAVEWAEMALKLATNSENSIHVDSAKETIATAILAVSVF